MPLVTRGNSCSSPCSKKGMSKVLPPQRHPRKEIRGKGKRFGGNQADRKAGRLVQCRPSHFSNILCVTSLDLLPPLPYTEKICYGCRMGRPSSLRANMEPGKAPQGAEDFAYFWWRTEVHSAPFLFNICFPTSKI